MATPAVVEFKDFEVGHTYKKRVAITNRSYARNTFRVLEVRARQGAFRKLRSLFAMDQWGDGASCCTAPSSIIIIILIIIR